jgi:hypothetical protein
MPVTLSQITKDIARTTITYPDGDLNIEYHPSRITRQMLAQLDAFNTMDEDRLLENIDGLIDLVLNVVSTWDLLEDDGTTTIALTKERLATVSILVLSQTLRAVYGNTRPEAPAAQETNETKVLNSSNCAAIS